ncbi:MAG: hypothetical protein ACFFAN_17090 [Promethearchaeota archaeon]
MAQKTFPEEYKMILGKEIPLEVKKRINIRVKGEIKKFNEGRPYKTLKDIWKERSPTALYQNIGLKNHRPFNHIIIGLINLKNNNNNNDNKDLK